MFNSSDKSKTNVLIVASLGLICNLQYLEKQRHNHFENTEGESCLKEVTLSNQFSYDT